MMLTLGLIVLMFSVLTSADKYVSGSNTDKAAAIEYMQNVNRIADEYCDKRVEAFHNYNRNKTEENSDAQDKLENEFELFARNASKGAITFAWKSLKSENPLAYRWFKLISLADDLALSDEKYKELAGLLSNMTDVLSSAKVCNGTDTCDTPTLEMIPDLDLIMMHSTNYEELKRVWKGYRDASGKKLREPFFRYVELKNEAAMLNGFANNGEYWREKYESETFQQDLENLWETIKPFYLHLHAYARKRLMTRYPGKIRPDGPIPAHILGNMWAGTWYPLFSLLLPYPNVEGVNVTARMIAKGMTVRDIFDLSEEFYTSLGLLPMPDEFWENTMMEKVPGEDFHCTASASETCSGKGVYIKMCGRVSLEDLYVVHHEMGHIQYYLQYAHQPLLFQNGANPGFHEALGDALALSVITPVHLKKIGLLQEIIDTPEADLNYLMKMALDNIAFLPFGYLMDLYRWKIFDGSITAANLNTKWWEIENNIQGICPPVRRTEEDFDAASLYHVLADFPYIRYFVSFIIQFQFHKALCKEAGHTGPLYKCDIYQSKAAGDILRNVLSKGSSIPWSEAMLIMTKGETDKIDASGLLEYFQPLIVWLENENAGETLGWTNDDPTICPTP